MPFHVHPAALSDIPRIAQLIQELYQAELPGALSGSASGQLELFEFTLQANGESALKNRYMLRDESGQTLGSGMIEFPREGGFERAPNGTIAKAFRAIGFFATLKLLGTVARSLLGVHRGQDLNSALIHSVVVVEAARGAGAGSALMNHLEGEIRARGLKRARLQVLANNLAALRFYARRGYKEIWRLSGWRAALSWASLIMEKEL
ncbi:MAG: GNAT family N-acetyltransferase [Anaerolineales bacterium]